MLSVKRIERVEGCWEKHIDVIYEADWGEIERAQRSQKAEKHIKAVRIL